MKKRQIQNIVREEWIKWSIDVPEIKDLLVFAKVGSPVCVYTPEGEPSYWFVPLISEQKVCGFASIDLNGKLIRNGIFGASSNDKNSWIEINYFNEPPKLLLTEIHDKYSGFNLSNPIFSFDGNPSRFAWLVKTRGKNNKVNIFITPGAWYVNKLFNNSKDRE